MSIDRSSIFSALFAYVSPYILPAICVIVALFIVISLTTSYVYTGDTIQDRFESMIDIFSNFFGSIIDTVKNGFNNVMDAIKGLVPSIDDIWYSIKVRVNDLIPDMPSLSGIYDYIDDEIDDLKYIVTSRISEFKDAVDGMIDHYLVDNVFEPMFKYVEYSWDHSRWIPWNLYFGIQQSVTHFVNQIPVIDWLNDNYDKLRVLI